MFSSEQLTELQRIKNAVQSLEKEAAQAQLYNLANILSKAIYVRTGAIGRYNPHRAIPKRCPTCLGKARAVLAPAADNNGYVCSSCGHTGDGWRS